MRSSAMIILMLMCSGLGAQNTFNVVFNNSIEQGWPSIGSGHGQNVLEVDSGYLVYGVGVSSNSFTKAQTAFINEQGQYISLTEILPTVIDTNSSFGLKRCFDTDNTEPYVLISTYEQNPQFFSTISLAKLTSTGDTNFIRTVIDSGIHQIYYSKELDNGTISGVGIVQVDSVTVNCFYMVCDSLGTLLFTNSFQTEGWLHGITETADGGVLLTGFDQNSNEKGLLICTDSVGNELWRRNFGGAAGNFLAPSLEMPNGDIIVSSVWKQLNDPGGPSNIQFKRWSSTGSLIYDTKPFPSSTWGNAPGDLIEEPDGGFICSGFLGLVGQSPVYRGLICKIDPFGNLVWSRTHHFYSGGIANHWFHDIDRTSDGGFILTGVAGQGPTDPHPTLKMTWLVKTDSLGCIVSGCQYVGIEEQRLEELNVFPNPFSDRLNIELPYLEQIAIYDLSGKMILQKQLSPLATTVLQLNTLPKGFYLLKATDRTGRVYQAKVLKE